MQARLKKQQNLIIRDKNNENQKTQISRFIFRAQSARSAQVNH